MTSDSIKGTVHDFGQAAARGADQAGDALKDVADRLPDSAAEAVEAGKRAYDRGAAQVSKRITKQPFEALLLAGAIGYLAGWAMSRS